MFESLQGIFRHLLTAGGGALAANGLIGASEVEALVGALLTVIGTIWSIIHKVRAKKKLQNAIDAPAGSAG